MPNILEIKELSKYFPVRRGIFNRKREHVHAVEKINFHLRPQETLGLVGESGCGKSTAGRTILRLIEPTSGQALFQGVNIFDLSAKDMLAFRRKVQIIFQDPFGSLNPRLTVERIIEEPLLTHKITDRSTRQKKIKEAMDTVGLLPEHMRRFPHEFSGGQRQRIMIARAMILQPQLIIADEPVSALDVSVQAQVLNLMVRMQKEFQFSYIFISHDLSVVRYVSHKVAVMYLGEIVETAPVADLYSKPMHPYTRSLLSALPVADPRKKKDRIILQGDVPSPIHPPSGCRFHPRCPERMAVCETHKPAKKFFNDHHWTNCHLYPA
ncbi:MAG: dipeptide ABC transporter ATP-binding protein [Desulfovermiculus sp.]|nr:dipeptide ABC transporter ATP-binding protein [Desulfovermiculus sp.]